MTSKKVVFFGSGPVAAASLRALAQNFDIEAVITKPSTKAMMSEAAPAASQILCETKAEVTAAVTSAGFASTVGIIVDFGIILEQPVLDSFELGIINSHFSLLPEWRGADPITFAVLSGQAKTGVSIMKIVPALDEGDLLAQESLDIDPTETTPTLTDKLVSLSNTLLIEHLPGYMDGKLTPYPQPTDKPASYSRKLSKQDGILDWNKPAAQLEREIRAFIGWPGSTTTLAGKIVQVLRARVVPASGNAGDVQATKKQLVIVCSQDGLLIERLKPAGKTAMDSAAFLAGNYQYI